MYMDKGVLIIGPGIRERGIGGVTIHVQRLMDYLDNQGVSYLFLDYKTYRLNVLLGAISNNSKIHFHISNPLFLCFLVCYAWLKKKKTIVTLHEDYGRHGYIKNKLIYLAIKLATAPIVLNEHSFKLCKEININTRLIPAFIPPQKEEKLQPEVLSLIDRLRAQKKTIVSTNAYNVLLDKDGNDVYGIDFLVHFFKDDERRVLLVSDPSGNYHKKYFNQSSNSVFFIDYPHPYYELLKHVDFFVRNTSTDGDALSVKEALFLGVPTICTDVVDRPMGALLYKYSDKESFENCFYKKRVQSQIIDNGAERIVSLYRSL